MSEEAHKKRVVLVLQGPLSSFYSDIAQDLIDEGCTVIKVHFCGNDVADWRHEGALRFTQPLSKFRDFLDHEMHGHGVTHVLLHGDRRPYHKIAATWAQDNGIKIVATELGYLRPDWMTVERNACSARSHFPNDRARIEKIAASAAAVDPMVQFKDDPVSIIKQEARFTFFNLLYRFAFPNYITHRSQSPFVVYSGWLLAKMRGDKMRNEGEARLAQLTASSTPYFVFALQLNGDFQLRDHSPFDSMIDAIEFTLSSFARNANASDHLVLKPHPHEFKRRILLQEIECIARKLDLSDRIHVIEGVPLPDLCQTAKGFVTVNSSGGLEALDAQCPTACIMPTIYDVDGLTHQGTLNEFWAEPPVPDKQLFTDLKKALAATIQVRGTLYNENGRRAAAKAIARRLVDDKVNEPGAFVDPPPRLAKAKQMGVTYAEQ